MTFNLKIKEYFSYLLHLTVFSIVNCITADTRRQKKIIFFFQIEKEEINMSYFVHSVGFHIENTKKKKTKTSTTDN